MVLALLIGGGAVYFFLWNDRINAVMVSLNEVPEPLVKKAEATLPEVKFDHARKLSNGNYEIRGKAKNGKVREVELNSTGDVVEIE
jgi:hypothetical protein